LSTGHSDRTPFTTAHTGMARGSSAKKEK
jgi:hypothetical protein